MMKIITAIYERIKAIRIMGQKTLDDRKFVTIPIHGDLERILNTFPPLLIKTLSTKWFLILTSLLFFTVGPVSDSNVLIAFSVSLAIYLHLIHYKTWMQSCCLKIDAINYPREWQVGRPLPFTFTVANEGSTTIEKIETILIFDDGLESWHHMLALKLPKGAKKKISLELSLDHGVGNFSIGPLYYIISDDLELYPKTLRIELNNSINIIGNISSPIAPKIEIASIANQVGTIEMNLPGRSTNFYGLRPWRHGDSIRYIDWKRSIRKGDIIVKDFERLTSTDAYIFFDLSNTAHSKYLDFSVFESLKSIVMSLALGLKQLSIATNIISQSNKINPDIDEEHLIQEIHKIQSTRAHTSFPELINENIYLIKPESLVILVFCSHSFRPRDLSESILWFEDQHIQCISFVLDSRLYAMEIFQKAELSEHSEDPLNSFYYDILKKNTNLREYQNIPGDIYWLDPRYDFLELCSDSEKLRILNDQ